MHRFYVSLAVSDSKDICMYIHLPMHIYIYKYFCSSNFIYIHHHISSFNVFNNCIRNTHPNAYVSKPIHICTFTYRCRAILSYRYI